MRDKLTGLIPAVYTPMNDDYSLNLDLVPGIVDYLCGAGVGAMYVGGSTGEGVSLSMEERKAVAEAYKNAAAGRVSVVIQVGRNSLADAQALAAHAKEIGADAISATAPTYYKPENVDVLVDCMSEISSAASGVPLYYYHIPKFTGGSVDMVEFLEKGSERMPDLRGIKFSDLYLATYQACFELQDRKFDVLWGCDEMLLSALAVGAQGAVGTTFNFMAPLYQKVIEFFNAGDIEKAQKQIYKSVQILRVLNEKHAPFAPAMKFCMSLVGLDCGPCRLPQARVSKEAGEKIREELEKLGFGE